MEEKYFFDSRRAIIKRIKMAKLIDENYSLRPRLPKRPIHSGLPATREDIELLLGEIQRVKRNVERIISL